MSLEVSDCVSCSALQFACTTAALGVIAAELVLRDPYSSTASDTQTSRSSSSKAESPTRNGGEQALAQILSHPLFRPAAAGAAGAVILSAVLPSEELPVLSSLCLVAYAGLAVTKERQQQQPWQPQQHEPQQRPQKPASGPAAQQAAPDGQEILELQQQLQRQTDKVSSLSMKVQQLERDLKQARKATRKLDSLKDELKQEQSEKQQLVLKALLAEQGLMQTQEKLAAEQAKQQASQAQAASSSQAASPEAPAPEQQQSPDQPAAGAPPVRRVAAFVGGRGMKESDRKLLPADVTEVRFYGSPRDTGSGDMKRLESAIKAGTINEVYMLIRWNGHGVTQQVSKLCRDRGIPYYLLDAAGKTRRKQEWGAATSSSDGELSELEPC